MTTRRSSRFICVRHPPIQKVSRVKAVYAIDLLQRRGVSSALAAFAMDQLELEKIVTAWITAFQVERGSAEYEANWWAISEVLEWAVDDKADRLWPFLLEAYKRDLPHKVIANLAAGPLEDLLAKRGEDFIDRVEELARRDPKFNYLLGGVWRNTMTDEVWQRVQAIRNHVW